MKPCIYSNIMFILEKMRYIIKFNQSNGLQFIKTILVYDKEAIIKKAKFYISNGLPLYFIKIL